MKKIFTLLAGVLFALGAQAQDVYNLGGLTTSGFTFDASAFEAVASTEDSDGNPINGAISYILKDKVNWSDLAVAGTPVVFQYKNSGSKSELYKLYPDYVLVNGKDSRITITGLTGGSVVTFKVASKGSTAASFIEIENCTPDATNPADCGAKATDVADFVDYKFTATADGAITIQEKTGGFNIASVTIEDGSGTVVPPADPHAAQQWDFTTISDADVALLDADATNWKKSVQGEEPNQFNRYENQFVLDKVAGANNSTKLQANGSDLELTKDLLFGRFDNKLNANNLRIDEGKRLGLNGNNIVILINDCAAGDIVRIRYASTKTDEARGFTVDNGDPAEFTTIETAEQEIMVANPGTFELKTTAGVFVYALAINDTLPEEQASGISAVKAENAQNAPIYNLKGERVDAGYRGVVIMNGKKMLQK